MHKKFREIEDEFRPYDKKIYGFPFWDCMRVDLFLEILYATDTIGVAHRRVVEANYAKLIKKGLKKLKNSALNNPFIKSKFDYIFMGVRQHRRKIGPDGECWDIYCDPVINYIGRERCLLIEPPSVSPICNGRKVHTKNIACTDYMGVFKMLNIMKRIKPAHINGVTETYINAIQESICTTFGISIDLKKRVKSCFSNFQVAFINFKTLFSVKRPKAVFVICSYGKEALIASCKALSIPTIEIQHGMINPYHLGYSFPPPTKKTLFPDYFLSFGKIWENGVAMPINPQKIFPLGFPYIDGYRQKAKRIPKNKQIVFISQATIGKPLVEFAVQLSKAVSDDYKIIYKLHPGEFADWEKEYPSLVKSNIEILTEGQSNLYDILAQSEIQIGVYSTALYEGLMMNCKTFIVDLYGAESMRPLIQKGIAHLVKRPAEIDFRVPPPNEVISKVGFFVANWQENLANAMTAIRGCEIF